MIGRLPQSVYIGEEEYSLRTDYRNVLDVFIMFNDSEMSKQEKWICAVWMMLPHFEELEDLEEAIVNGFDLNEAIKHISWFIGCGKEKKNEKKENPVYDWEQDEQMIFSAINNVAKKEVREQEYIHWWTFLSYFNEIGEGLFSYVVGIRKKNNKHEKLDKSEKKFYTENKDMVDIKPRLSKEEQEFVDYIGELL